MRNIFKALPLLTLMVLVLSTTSLAQTRPRQVSQKAAAAEITRPRRVHSPTRAGVTEAAAAKQVDAFLEYFNHLIQDYIEPTKGPAPSAKH